MGKQVWRPVEFMGEDTLLTRTVEIKDDEAGFEPFEITFRRPNAAALASLALAAADGEQSRGEQILGFIADHLKGWSLTPPATAESLEKLADPEVLFGIFNVLHSAGSASKN